MNIKNDGLARCYNSYKSDLLKNAVFRKKAFTKGDHDHCLFDGKELSAIYENTDRQGYYFEGEYVWLCTECFEECIKRGYELELTDNTVDMIEQGLKNNKVITISLSNERYIIQNSVSGIIVNHNMKENVYKDFLTMEREQSFYGHKLREIIKELYISID